MIEVEKISVVSEGKMETRYLIKLPEYKEKIIVLEKHIDDLTNKLLILKGK